MRTSFYPIRLNRAVFVALSCGIDEPVKIATPFGFCRRRFSTPVYYTLYCGKAFYITGKGL